MPLDMKISDRFTDYGVIGGFFWMLQFALWASHSSGWAGLLKQFTNTINLVPPSASPSFVALLGAVGLIVVFTTGMLLDLFGSAYFRTWEATVFTNHVRRHLHWFQKVMDLSKDYVQDDVATLLANLSLSVQMRMSLKLFRFWNSRDMANYWRSFRDAWRARDAYIRTQSFLLSTVLLGSEASKVELLSTQMSLWNTARAVAAATMFCTVELILFPGGFALRRWMVPSGPFFVLMLVCPFIAIFVSLSAYQRVCSTLFALTYIVCEQQQRETLPPC
jgi:hypothetical protein